MAAREIWVALGPVAAAFDRLGVKYYVAGSVASSAYGLARATMDVDLVANLRQADIDPLCDSLQPAYYVSRSALAEAVARKSCFNVIHLETMLKVDVFVARNRRYDAIAIERIRQDTFDEDDPATRFWLAAPEDVVLSKLEWFRLGGEVSERQWGDVVGVLKVQGESLDRGYLQQWAGELGIADLLATAWNEAEKP
jgi:hypothetical protein